ncbi:MAG: GTPase ObgE, partial [Deltaproteobacteria bacterium]|nr:GTPase ObgE [Deltaproteobacteria bacterium]
DIPGLIAGANTGAGLGIKFLKHIERTRVLLHLIDPIDPTHADPMAAYQTVRSELAAFDPALLGRPECIVFTKQDIPAAVHIARPLAKELIAQGHNTFRISAVTGEGIPELLHAVWVVLRKTITS